MDIELRGIVTLVEVFNVRKSIEFYRDLLGFEVRESAGQGEYLCWARLKHGDVELMLNSMCDPGEEPEFPDATRIAAHQDTTLFIGCPDIDGAYTQLRAMGVPVAAPVVTPYGMKQVSLTDPDGYGICLQWAVAKDGLGARSATRGCLSWPFPS